VDDLCTRDILDRHLGFATHKTQVEGFSSFSKKELKYLDIHRAIYNRACSSSSRFEIQRCLMYKNDGDVGAKVVTTKPLKSGTVLSELCGRLVTVRDSFLKSGQNDFSVVHCTYRKKSQLWLGPASYANRDCENNCSTYYLKDGKRDFELIGQSRLAKKSQLFMVTNILGKTAQIAFAIHASLKEKERFQKLHHLSKRQYSCSMHIVQQSLNTNRG